MFLSLFLGWLFFFLRRRQHEFVYNLLQGPLPDVLIAAFGFEGSHLRDLKLWYIELRLCVLPFLGRRCLLLRVLLDTLCFFRGPLCFLGRLLSLMFGKSLSLEFGLLFLGLQFKLFLDFFFP